jgi:hypothetical protein
MEEPYFLRQACLVVNTFAQIHESRSKLHGDGLPLVIAFPKKTKEVHVIVGVSNQANGEECVKV